MTENLSLAQNWERLIMTSEQPRISNMDLIDSLKMRVFNEQVNLKPKRPMTVGNWVKFETNAV